MPSPNSEVVFVQSKIRSPALGLSPATFKKWYEQIHIPDVLALPNDEVKYAFRYIIADTAEEDEIGGGSGFPYLAVYPGLRREWLASEECGFLKVPLHSEVLPGPEGFVFGVADFEMGAYEVLGGKLEWGEWGRGPMKFVVVVPMGEETVKGRGFGEVLGESLRKLGLEGAGLSTLVRYDFSPTGQPPRQPEVQKGVLFIGREYLAIHQVEKPPTDLSEQWGKKPVVYNLIGAFGDVNKGVE